MDEQVKKRVDESWKEQAEREKQTAAAAPQAGLSAACLSPSDGRQAPGTAQAGQPSATAGKSEAPASDAEGLPHARFDLFVSGLAMEALIAMGDMPHPTTRKHATNLPQAKYLIDLLGVLEAKTKGNLIVEEEKLLKDALYQLRMRYLAKAGG